ncbi:amino acid adenylation domain-containing protein [Candidatus Albibeggiatoa sp. nov. BB20]|uniref:amino acid adenylation domain-containing protein n=1 Tax=Candidatus Albibeggiatoa sp. nov. BB20 TaxID=3162723 RepID=UPI00336570D3
MNMNTTNHLVELLQQRCLQTPNKIGYIFLKDGHPNTELKLSYYELDCKIRSLAAKLQKIVTPSERAILFYPQGLDYIIAFYACLYAGITAIPTYSPHRNRPDKRILSIVEDAQPKVVLTTSSTIKHKDEYIKNTPKLGHAVWIDSTVDEGLADDWKMPKISAQTLAFLQYTSGSTGLPKGVQVSHENIMQNSKYIRTAFQLSENSVSVTWLPSFHDMGLIDGIIQPLYSGFLGVIMPSVTFLQKPLLWLQNISYYKATHCGGPNFGYDLCVQKITAEERQTLDLNHWYSAYNGAEPINKETLERFSQTFAECGFKPNYFYPCYGMAETTLMVSGGELEQTYRTCIVDANSLEAHKVVKLALNRLENRDKKTFRELVSCGHIWLDNQVEIVNPETLKRCNTNEVGEIWVKGKSVTQGYWQNPEATEKAFNAYIVDTGEGSFLRTGDLGFFDEGELFVTGRLKDVIIIRGRNYYPQDIEATLEQSHFTLKTNASAAFSVDIDGEEKLMVAIEVERRYNRERRKHAESKQSLERRHRSDRRENPYAGYTDDRDEPLNAERVIQTIRQNVSEQHGLQVYAVLLLRVGSIPKTTSGKIQRHACRQGFLDGSLNVVGSDVLDSVIPEQQNHLNRDMLLATPQSKYPIIVNAYVHDLICNLLNIPSYYFDWQHSINKLGIDSLAAVELQHRIEKDLGVHLPMAHFLQDTTVAVLADSILRNLQNPTIEPQHIDNDDAYHPLSYNQQALWFLYKLAPQSAAYNIFFAVDITSPLNLIALQKAFQSMTDRHPALRTQFSEQLGKPVQKTCKELPVDFDMIDMSLWSEQSINQYLTEQSRKPFDLEKQAMMRVRLCQYSDTKATLLWVVHHICIDLWSMSILLEELQQFYTLYSLPNQMIDLPNIEANYIDFAYWQQTMLDNDKGKQQEQYWLQKLSGELPVLDLPTDYVRPNVQTYVGASIGFQLDPKMTQALKAMVKSSGTTLYTLLLAAFQTLLHRYTQQNDILVGSASAGRCHANFDDVVGYFTNMLVLRADFSNNPTFNDFLHQVQTNVLEALENQHYPFSLLVEKLLHERDPSRSPLFQVGFGLQKPHKLPECAPFVLKEKGTSMKLGNLHLESRGLEQNIAQFDISLLMVEIDNGLMGSWEYNTALFKPETIERMKEHFLTLLSSIIDDSKQTVSNLDLLPASEQQQLIAWNQTQQPYPQRCAYQLFEQCVEQMPNNVAVVFEIQSLTYQQLNQKANQLAHYLRHIGLKTEGLVGICVERSLDMIVGLLGIMKAGGVYVPLDPTYPKERLGFMLQDAQVSILLTQSHLQANLPQHQARVICLDTDWTEMAQQPNHNPDLDIQLNNLAYVIYTSGSTGKPKGVLLEHAGLTNLATYQIKLFDVQPQSRVLQFVSLSFDVSIGDITMALCSGASLYLVDQQKENMGENLVNILKRDAITHVEFPVSVVDLLPRTSIPSLQVMVVGGDFCSHLLASYWSQSLRFINAYGPTEATVCTTFASCKPDSTQAPPIGYPLANLTLYVLDENQQRLPIGAVGELYIGGIGVARGYLNRPDLTAQKFILNPFKDNADDRLYRTGDLVRFLPDGQLDFVGRVDNQVKIRGFRIELDEIEHVLAQYLDIQVACVIVREDQANDKRIVAYFVTQVTVQIEQLRQFMQQALPDYMLPKVFVQLDTLPLTPNGKIDRKALPKPDIEQHREQEFVAAQTTVEQVLVSIWSEVLHLDNVSVNDNFFALGGDSILSIQVVARANQQQIKLTPRLIFQYQTIAQLASVVQLGSSIQAQQGLVAGNMALTPIQNWFFAQSLLNPHYYNQLVLLKVANQTQAEFLQSAFQYILQHHDALRLQFQQLNGQWQQQNLAKAAPFTLQIEDLANISQAEKQDKIQAVTLQTQASLNIETAKLLNAVLFQNVDTNTAYLFIAIHHLAVDGVSWRILLEDIASLYQQLEQQQTMQLSPKTTAFQDWAAYLQNIAATDLNYEFWIQQLQNAPCQIPTDFAAHLSNNTVQTRQEVSFILSTEQTNQLLQNVHQAYNTQINDILLTALALAVSKWTAQTAILFDLEGHGRDLVEDELDLSRTVGWFTSMYPVVLQTNTTQEIETSIKSIKEQLRAIPNHGIHYGILRYLSQNDAIQQQFQHLPQAQISFNYLGQFEHSMQNGLFLGMSAEKTAFYHAQNNQRSHLIDFNLMILDGTLKIDCAYSSTFHQATTINTLVKNYVSQLQELIEYCIAPQTGGYTPSDFPETDLSQDDLDNLLEQL